MSVKLSDEVKASSFKKGQQLFIDPAKMLPLQRFLPGADQKGTLIMVCSEIQIVYFKIGFCLKIIHALY